VYIPSAWKTRGDVCPGLLAWTAGRRWVGAPRQAHWHPFWAYSR